MEITKSKYFVYLCADGFAKKREFERAKDK
jgi:hypothetical protein